MTLYNVVKKLEDIALKQPNVRSTSINDIYRAMNGNPAIKYARFHISQTTHRTDDEFDYYGFNLFFVDRLKADLETNALQIQSIAKDVLTNIVRTFCELYDASVEDLEFHSFTEKFNDETAGCYMTVELILPVDSTCQEDY